MPNPTLNSLSRLKDAPAEPSKGTAGGPTTLLAALHQKLNESALRTEYGTTVSTGYGGTVTTEQASKDFVREVTSVLSEAMPTALQRATSDELRAQVPLTEATPMDLSAEEQAQIKADLANPPDLTGKGRILETGAQERSSSDDRGSRVLNEQYFKPIAEAVLAMKFDGGSSSEDRANYAALQNVRAYESLSTAQTHSSELAQSGPRDPMVEATQARQLLSVLKANRFLEIWSPGEGAASLVTNDSAKEMLLEKLRPVHELQKTVKVADMLQFSLARYSHSGDAGAAATSLAGVSKAMEKIPGMAHLSEDVNNLVFKVSSGLSSADLTAEVSRNLLPKLDAVVGEAGLTARQAIGSQEVEKGTAEFASSLDASMKQLFSTSKGGADREASQMAESVIRVLGASRVAEEVATSRQSEPQREMSYTPRSGGQR